jgi:hypothetical protein
MDNIQIEKVKQVLVEWNPLGDQAYKVKDLENYQIETVDLLFYIDKKSSIDRINKIMNDIMSEAFGVYHDLNKTRKFAEKIRKILND